MTRDECLQMLVELLTNALDRNHVPGPFTGGCLGKRSAITELMDMPEREWPEDEETK